jgi:SAM-dependent methyltransferase
MLTSLSLAFKRRITLYPGTMVRRRAVLPRLLALTPQKGKVLDAGCGAGTTLAFLARKRPQVRLYGVDFDRERICDAQKVCAPHKNITLIFGDVAKTRLPENLDVICCSELLEHLPNPSLVVRKLSHAMKPGGHLLLHTPHIPKHYSLKPSHPRWKDPGHFRDGFTAEELKAILTSAGLQVVEVKYTFGLFGALAWELPMLLFQSLPLKLVNLLLFPVTALLSLLDSVHHNRYGNGILIISRK